MTNRARAGEHFARLTYMAVVMTSEASGPVTVSDVVWIGRPVNFHRGKDVSVVNGEDGIYGLFNLGFLILHNFRVVPGIISFDRLPDFFVDVLMIVILFYQCVQGKLLDPGELGGDIPAGHRLVHSCFRREEDMGGPVMAIHTIHEVHWQVIQFFVRNLRFPVFVNHDRPV